DYREWVFLSSGLGMSYGSGTPNAEDPPFDNVFVLPSAYKAFLETGRWPDQTVFILEVRASTSNGSINKAGHFQTDLLAIEAEVKDASRFPGKWAFFSLGKGATAGRQLPTTEACYSCHAEHGAVDNTFVQFYPTLLTVARQKGTLK
ncbi:MAG TPA: cytochrome P460 family protein, partial [Bryobacteraceae bacterium]|nr:cytochrome P460 family protein [Bryobacteraceae bacterium]